MRNPPISLMSSDKPSELSVRPGDPLRRRLSSCRSTVTSAVCTAATIHLCFATNNYCWVEVNPGLNESADDIFPVQLERQGPSYPLPTRPGLGVEFDEVAAAAHPHSLRDMPHFHKPDGSHTNW